MEIPIYENMPYELTIEETGNHDFEIFHDLEGVRKYYNGGGNGQLYTQVDAGMDVVYLRGYHLVNRTGVYIIVVPT